MKKKLLMGLALVVVVAFVASCSKGYVSVADKGKATGKTFTVDQSGDAGRYVSLDLDSKNNAHMVYIDKKNKSLKYVRQEGTAFAPEVVDAGCAQCMFASIKVGADDAPHLAYYHGSKKTLLYAYKKEGVWKTEKIEWGEKTGMGAQLLFDKEQNLHALYYSGDGYLKHAWRVLNTEAAKPKKKKPKPKAKGEKVEEPPEPPEGIWGTERVDKANGSEKVQISLVVQPNGRLAASFFHWSGMTSELRMAMQDANGKWSTEIVSKENNPGKSSAMMIAPNGEAHIIFREARKDRLSIARFSSEGWAQTPLQNKVYNMALASNDSGNLLVAYAEMSGRDPRKGHLCMLLRTGEAWSRYDVDNAKGSGTHLDADLTSDGAPVIAYYEERGKSLKLFIGQ
jgi:hypothetical protein